MTIKEELQSGATLRALSWKEPYASMMLHGKIETRTWDTKVRGLVLICSSKRDYSMDSIKKISGWNQFNRINAKLTFNHINWNLTKGNAIAIGRLVNCRPMTLRDEDKTFVTLRFGLWCHIYEEVTAIEPFLWKGKQGWSIVPQDIINLIKFK
jgi:hypothetical protein